MIPLYILGLIQRFGPQHGYQIKKLIGEQLADFTQIKLPTIYYHLKRMEEEGLLSAQEVLEDKPEKIIYSITENGREALMNMLVGLLNFDYRPVFPSDSVFYFADYLQKADVVESLEQYSDKLKRSISIIEKHKNDTFVFIPEEDRMMAGIIFSHHEHHYQAELTWVEETLRNLK